MSSKKEIRGEKKAILDIIDDNLKFREGVDELGWADRWPEDEGGVGLGKAGEQT